MKKFFLTIYLLLFSFVFTQETIENKFEFVFEPDSLFLRVGETGSVTIKLVNSNGELANNPFYIYGRPRRSLESSPRISDSTGIATVSIKPYKPGKLTLSVRSISQKREDRVYGGMTVQVPFPPLERIVFDNPQKKLYLGTSLQYKTTVFDQANLLRDDAKVELSTSNNSIAEFDNYGNLKAKKTGKEKVVATAENISLVKPLKKRDIPKAPIKDKEIQSIAII